MSYGLGTRRLWLAALEPYGQDRNIGGRNSRDTRGLAQGGWSNGCQLRAGFSPEARHQGVVKPIWNRLLFERFESLYFDFLAVNVALVFDFDFNLLHHLWIEVWIVAGQGAIGDLRSAQDTIQSIAIVTGCAEAVEFGLQLPSLGDKLPVVAFGKQTHVIAELTQAHVSIVLPQEEPVLGTGCE